MVNLIKIYMWGFLVFFALVMIVCTITNDCSGLDDCLNCFIMKIDATILISLIALSGGYYILSIVYKIIRGTL